MSFLSLGSLGNAIKNKRRKLGKDLRPILDYHSRIFITYYPYDKLLEDYFLLPVIYISSGDLQYSTEHKVPSTNTQGGVIVDDWGIINDTLTVSNVKIIFDAYELSKEKVALFFDKFILEKNMQSLHSIFQMLINKTDSKVKNDYQFHLDLTSKEEVNKFQLSERLRKSWQNRGINLLDRILTLYRNNGTLFDDQNIPVISGLVAIETDFMYQGKNNVTDYNESPEGGFKKAIKTLIKGAKDFETEQLKGVYSGGITVYPATVLYGKFSSLSFNINGPFSADLSFNFDVMGSRRNVVAPWEGKDPQKQKPVKKTINKFLPSSATYRLIDTSISVGK